MTAPTVDCPSCGGAGEHVVCPTGCDGSHIGDQATTCPTCDGIGSVTPEQVAEYADTHCAHGVHDDDPEGCWTCNRDRLAALPPVDENPWQTGAATVRGGWDAEPPF